MISILLFSLFASTVNGTILDITEGPEVKILHLPYAINQIGVGSTNPCSIVTLDDLKQLLDLGDTEVRMEEDMGNFPSCQYKWNDGRKRVMKVAGSEYEVDVENTVMLVMVEGKVTESMYEQSISSYTDELQALDAGDIAVWSHKNKQATVLYKEHLFHVYVDCFNDSAQNKRHARLLAEMIIDRAY